MDKDQLKCRIHRDFSYPRNPDKAKMFEETREKCKELALFLVDTLPLGRELDTALTRLEEVAMHSSAAIARIYPPNP